MKQIGLLLFFSFICHLPTLFALTAEEILEKADAIRNPKESFYMKVKVTTQGEEDSLFEVFTEGKEKTLIKTVEPARSRGRTLLMVEENMWAYIPNLKRSVRVALSQKLTGQTANGDIGRMRLYGDYTPTLLSEEKGSWQLQLKARKKGLTYEEILLDVDQKNFHPLKAIYKASTGKILKEAHFINYQKLAGTQRPSIMTIQSATNINEKSTLEILEMEERKFPKALFDQNNLP